MKNIILCADDYGQNGAISQGIIQLIQDQRITATSCMTTSCRWQDAAAKLLPWASSIDVGLHFNLTEGISLAKRQPFTSLPSLMMKAITRILNVQDIKEELHAQLDAFAAEMGRLPDYIDGHQHVHQFPQIRQALFEVYEERLRTSNVYFRCTYNRAALFKDLKTLIINVCGGMAFKKQLQCRGIPHNASFAGIYNFSTEQNYASFFARFLNQSLNRGLIMCHPGFPSTDEDPIKQARQRELLFLSSDEFIQLLRKHEVRLTRFTEK